MIEFLFPVSDFKFPVSNVMFLFLGCVRDFILLLTEDFYSSHGPGLTPGACWKNAIKAAFTQVGSGVERVGG